MTGEHLDLENITKTPAILILPGMSRRLPSLIIFAISSIVPMNSAMPYRDILRKVMREYARLGVPFRLVNAHHPSILGNLLATKDYRLGRDVAAAGIIAMLGLSPRALDTRLKEIVASSKSLRINVKNKFGRRSQSSS